MLVGWSMACGELLKYVEQFSMSNIGGLVLVDGFISDQPSASMLEAMAGWMNQLQEDRQKQADGLVRNMFKEPKTEQYLKRLIDAAVQVPADTAVILIYNMIAVKDWSGGFARIEKPMLFAYQPDSQATADFLKAKLDSKLRLEKSRAMGTRCLWMMRKSSTGC